MPEENSYDRVGYPGFPFAETHPDRLAVMARLQGMAPASPEKCRMLELGCGDGGNLIPMAYQLPGSTFVGVDLSGRAIATGNETVAGLGLKNIVLEHRDIAELAAEDGQYDYIVAHGVYSWVPQPVRDKILDIFARSLAPQGIAYVSYNALPGAHLRDLVRSLMLFHVRGVTDDNQRNIQSRMLLDMLAKASIPDSVYGAVLRDQQERVRDTPDQVLIHDDLDSGSQPFFLYQVVEAAARRGLQFVGEATPFTNSRFLTDDGRRMLEGIPESEIVVREQYWDFIRGTAFRKTLFCRHDVSLNRTQSPDCVKDYFLTSDLGAAPGDIDPSLPDLVEFKTAGGDALRTDHRGAKAAFVILGNAWPRQFTYAELAEEVASLIREASGKPPDPADLASLPEALFEAFETGLVQMQQTRRGGAPAISERPTASRLARWQIARGPFVTNLLHASIVIDDEMGRRFLPLVDGSRTVADLVTDLSRIRATIPPEKIANDEPPVVDHDTVTRKLKQLARLGLLSA